ncbi:NAD(P)H-binding protein [Kribbella sp. NBC_01245]|uniref:NAD(P)H-binding protein n=1 Tax=Kribbella sp. NBC_01245 TaxID=2903578 RepID=UPI002E29AAAF|nr:NAD(P)H-binding protein [Kribbella sp. NBC_01245]
MAVLVTGATGNVGRLVVEQLAAAGEDVRAMTRTPGKAVVPHGVTVVKGDLRDPEGLEFDGVDRLFLFAEPSTAREVVGRAVKAGVRRIVVLSSGAVTFGMDSVHHLPAEQAVEESGVEWTHVRPGEFMANKLHLWGPSIRAERIVREAFPDSAWYPVHERDIADVATVALRADGHHGSAYDVNGPLISNADQVRAISAALGEEVRLELVSREELRERYLAQGGFAAEMADFLLGYTDYSGAEADAEDEVDYAAIDSLPTAEAVTGRPARTFADWAQDHLADFR